MYFFMPPGIGVDDPDVAFRDIRAFAQDATGWHIYEERIYFVEYVDRGEVRSAKVGEHQFGGTVACILSTDLVVMVCTANDGHLGTPVMVEKRNVVNAVWFEGFEPEHKDPVALGPEPPSGNITFLFTDIEGSTRLWEQDSVNMRVALARHDILLHQVVSGNFGYVFKTIGDTFCCAFQCASDALQAAIDAQLAFRAGYWPEIVSFKVRMAIHTGLADIMGNDYFGPPLNCTSRLLKAGHGGQILLSGETCEASVNIFPKSSSIKLLGTHALRDLRRPVTIFQLCYPGLQCGFPALRLDNPPGGTSAQTQVAA